MALLPIFIHNWIFLTLYCHIAFIGPPPPPPGLPGLDLDAPSSLDSEVTDCLDLDLDRNHLVAVAMWSKLACDAMVDPLLKAYVVDDIRKC